MGKRVKASYEGCREIERTHLCAACGGRLVTWWAYLESTYRVSCGSDRSHEGFVQTLSWTQAERQGVAIPLEIAQALEKKRRQRMDKTYEVTSRETGEIHQVVAPSAQEACRLCGWLIGNCQVTEIGPPAEDQGVFLPVIYDLGTSRDLTVPERQLLITWSRRVGLKPELGHVMLYHGRPYPTVDGLIYNARQTDPAMSHAVHFIVGEEKLDMGLGLGDVAARARVFNGKGQLLAERIGIVRFTETTEKSEKDPSKFRYPVVAKKPHEMAENRALWDALGDAFPLQLQEAESGG